MAGRGRRCSWAATLALAMTVGILAAESAGAATLSRSLFPTRGSDGYTFQADAGEADVVDVDNVTGGRFTITDSADTITLGSNTGACTGGGTNTVNCPVEDRLTLNLEDGNDATTIENSILMSFTLNGDAGNDSLDGGGQDDRLFGGSGAETSLSGDAGDDYVEPGAGTDTGVSGDLGTDTISYDDGRLTGVTVDLEATSGQGNGTGGDSETVTAFENIEGTDAVDTLTGTTSNNVVVGGAGADTLDDGGSGVDTLAYTDRSTAVSVNLVTEANTDGDVLAGTGEWESVIGTSAGDTLSASGASFRARLTGGGGEDSLTGGAQPDTLDGGPDSDSLAGNAGDDILIGGTNADVHNGGSGNDSASYRERTGAVVASLSGPSQDGDTYNLIEDLEGGASGDTLTGDGASNELRGNTGADILIGGGGSDVLLGNEGAGGEGTGDTASYEERGTAVTTTLGGGATQDGDLYSEIQNLTGGSGNDVLTGDAQANALLGGPGADTLTGGTGADALTGGDGADVVSYADRATPVAASLATGANPDADTLVAVEGLRGGTGADELTGDVNANGLEGGSGDDLLTGGLGADDLRGEDGNDTLRAQDGVGDGVDCGAGDDQAENDAADSLTGCERQSVFVVDNDGDGFDAAADCDDANAAIRPGAAEIPGNAVDENCDGVQAPFPLLAATMTHAFRASAKGTVLTKLTVNLLEPGSTVTVTCKTPGKRRKGRNRCPFARRTFAISEATAKLKLTRSFKGRRLPVGTKVTITITSPDAIGKRYVLKVRRGRAPSRKLTCLAPGGGTTAC